MFVVNMHCHVSMLSETNCTQVSLKRLIKFFRLYTLEFVHVYGLVVHMCAMN